MRKIVVFIGGYLPGYKYGGALRSLTNLVGQIGDEYHMDIVCADRDMGSEKAYENIKHNQWNRVGKANVWYLPPGGFTFSKIYKFAREYDVVYSCGFFEPYCYKTLILHKFGLLKNVRIVVASMGVFSAGALALKKIKKVVFIKFCKFLKLTSGIVWSVSSELEKNDVQRNMGKKSACIIARDVAGGVVAERQMQQTDLLRVVFLSRISPKKNLTAAVEALKNLDVPVRFAIYGPIEDERYWQKVLRRLHQLPPHIKWGYHGGVTPEEVGRVFAASDLLLFPTLGENYGHVILEALAAGCIPVISDLTMWQRIADVNAGYILPLSDKMTDFTVALREFAQKSPEERFEMVKNAQHLAQQEITESQKCTGYRKLFD